MLSKTETTHLNNHEKYLSNRKKVALNALTSVSYCEFYYFLNTFRDQHDFIKINNNIDFLINLFDKYSVSENKIFHFKYKNYNFVVPTKYFIKTNELTLVILNKHVLSENYAFICLCLFIENGILPDGIYYLDNDEKYHSLNGLTNLDKDFSNINPNILSTLVYCVNKLKKNKRTNKINTKSKGFYFSQIEAGKILDRLIKTILKGRFKKETSQKCKYCKIRNKCNTFLEDETFNLY